MISANEIRNRQISVTQVGYDKDEVNALLDEAAETVDAYVNESKELYRKMEILAQRIEEYREEEDSIKAALITAEKMADSIKKESNEKANALISSSEEHAKAAIDDANTKADKIISEAREYSSKLIADKSKEANAIVADAEKKANEAINSSKIVAQNILDQAKEISDDLVTKSREQKEAYELLITALKSDAKSFIENVKALYTEQLEVLGCAKLESTDESKEESSENVDALQKEVESLVSEMKEMESAIPEAITIDAVEYNEPKAEPIEDINAKTDEEENVVTVVEESADEESSSDIIASITEETDNAEKTAKAPEEFEIIEEDSSLEPFELVGENPADPMEAVEAFSKNEETGSDTDKSLFDDEENQLPFESYFNVKKDDVHGDRTQTISLVPPEEEDDDEEPKFKGFFKKKK
ncbi:MAG: DivIVA domain-containing protein [Eubacterium sp.]